MVSTGEYRARHFNLGALQGISDETLEMHFKLYEGYVKETNKLNEKIADFVRGGTGDPDRNSTFRRAAEQSFGSYDIWKAEFTGIGKMRGVGWAICNENPANGRLSNHWITLHETGNVAGFNPALVMDVWEHAFILDYKPADRAKYIEAFFSNIDWAAVDKRTHRLAHSLAA